MTIDPDVRDEIRVTVVATGLTRNNDDISSTPKPTTQQRSNQTAQSNDEEDVPAISRQAQSNPAANNDHVASTQQNTGSPRPAGIRRRPLPSPA